MSHRKLILIGVLVFFIQFFLLEYLTIKFTRPDFILIFILYVAIEKGSTAGVLYGFTFGLLEDMVGVGSLFGLAPLTKSIFGFSVGFLQGRYTRMNPITYHMIWLSLTVIYFLIYVYIRFQVVYEFSQLLFWKKWFFTMLYTFVFILIFQVIRPIQKVSQEN